MQRVSARLLTHNLTAFGCGIFRSDHSVLAMKMLKKVGADDVEELADKPGTTNGTQFDTLQSMCLASFGELWFSTAGPMVGIPMILADVSREKELRVFLQEA